MAVSGCQERRLVHEKLRNLAIEPGDMVDGGNLEIRKRSAAALQTDASELAGLSKSDLNRIHFHYEHIAHHAVASFAFTL